MYTSSVTDQFASEKPASGKLWMFNHICRDTKLLTDNSSQVRPRTDSNVFFLIEWKKTMITWKISQTFLMKTLTYLCAALISAPCLDHATKHECRRTDAHTCSLHLLSACLLPLIYALKTTVDFYLAFTTHVIVIQLVVVLLCMS